MAITHETLSQPEFVDRHHEPDAALVEAFRFDLKGHELINPALNRGYVAGSIEKVDPVTTFGTPIDCDVYEVNVVDPFVDADPEAYQAVRAYVDDMEEVMRSQGFDPLEDRYEATSRSERNKFTEAWLHDDAVTSLGLWRDLVPTAEALDYLTKPWVERVITNSKGETGVISPETAAQIRFVDDAVAIRDRAIAMQTLVEEHLIKHYKTGDSIKWLSLASGTAEPAIAAARTVSEEADLSVDLTVADYDRRALSYVQSNAEQYGFTGKVRTIRENILSPNIKEKLESKTEEPAQYDVVENMGFEEYLPQEGDELGAKKGQGLPQASEFTRRAFEMVKPGGVLISGNMVIDRPQIGFVFGIVDWPIINARSEESILRVYEEAGILSDPNAKVELYRIRNAQTGGRVYDIVKVTKLAENED